MNTESTRPAIGIDIIHRLGCDNIDIGEESQYMSILMTCLSNHIMTISMTCLI